MSCLTISFWSESGVSVQDQRAAIGGREGNVEHLDGGDVEQALGMRCRKALRYGARGLNLDELAVELPQLGRIPSDRLVHSR